MGGSHLGDLPLVGHPVAVQRERAVLVPTILVREAQPRAQGHLQAINFIRPRSS